MQIQSFSEIHETSDFLNSKGIQAPSVGIVLGTGLGSLVEAMTDKITVSFDDCPHFPKATAISHAGNLIYGDLCGKKVLALEGRFHLYEGYTMNQVTYPIRVMQGLGIKHLILTNAAGALNPDYALGDLMVTKDHISFFMGAGPLEGPNDDELGDRFPDMIEPYAHELQEKALKVAEEQGLKLHQGVYVGVRGPQLETRAEYKLLRQVGADAVGMSTVPEAIVAVHAKMKTLAISCLTDLCTPETLEPINIEKIIQTAQAAEPKITQLIQGVLRKI